MSQIESTYKSRDVEETIDIYFYRPIGYVIARVCKALGITPNAVTIVSIIIGVAGGHLLYYRDFTLNLYGILLWVVADILDSVDGQLARMTNHKSKLGRILDGFGGNIIFLSIYLHLMARMIGMYPEVWWGWFFLLVLASGFSHSVQSALADYYRNAYLKFVVDPAKSELEGADEIREEYKTISFFRHPIKKILMRVYLNYTVEQEAFSKYFQRLRRMVDEQYGQAIPSWFKDEYRRTNKPLMKYYAILTTNIRMIVMAICVLSNRPVLFFATEIIVFNGVMVLVTMHQEKLSRLLAGMIEQQEVMA